MDNLQGGAYLKDKKLFIKCVLTPLLSGGAIGYIATSSGTYKDMVKPPLSPPSWIFPVAWSILYILMGIALYLILVSPISKEERSKIKAVFASQLILNLLWSIIFFSFKAFYAAVLCLAALIGFIIKTYIEFKKYDVRSSNLLIPYILWCIFALYLNIGIAILN